MEYFISLAFSSNLFSFVDSKKIFLQGSSYGIFHFIGLSDLTVTNLFSFVDSKKYLFYGCTVGVLVHSQLAPVGQKLESAIH